MADETTRRMPKEIIESSRKNADALFKKLLIIVPLAFVLVAAILAANEASSLWDYEWWGIPILFLVIGAGVAGLALYVCKDDWKMALAYLAGIGTILVIWGLFKTGELYVGGRVYALYLLSGAVYLMMLKMLSEKSIFRKFFLFASFGVLGISHFYTYHDVERWAKANWGSGSGAQAQASTIPSTTAECPGNATTLGYKQGKYYIINEKPCQLRPFVKVGCVSYYDGDGMFRAKKCAGDPMPTAAGIYSMIPATDAVVRINHCAPFAPGTLVDKCA